jgi:hypothetical protein
MLHIGYSTYKFKVNNKLIQSQRATHCYSPKPLAGTNKGKIRKVQPGLSQKTVRVRENVGFVENLGISRRIVGKDNKHQKRTPQKKKIQL